MLRDTIDTLAPATMAGVESYARDPGILVVRTAPGTDRQPFVMFDGTTIETRDHVTTLVFTPGEKFTGGVLFEIIATAQAPTMVSDAAAGVLTAHGSYAALAAASEGWYFDPAAASGTLWIKMPGAATVTIQ